jgi:energy-coupling factor transporter ATP-binding protein EcfA2
MVASNRYDDHHEHLTEIPGDENKALPVAMIYGANGAGKSNLVRALRFIERLVMTGTDANKPINRHAFRLDAASCDEPSEFVLQFAEDGRAYVYGVRLSDSAVLGEWLSLLRRGKEIPVFERITGANQEVTIELGAAFEAAESPASDKLAALAKAGVLPNQLFLHAVAKGLQESAQGPLLASAIRWFFIRLTIIEPEATYPELAKLITQDPAFAKFAGEFLRRVGTGVDRLGVDTSEIDERVLSAIGPPIQRMLAELPPAETAAFSGPDGSELIVERGEGTKLRLRTVNSEHIREDGSRIVMPFTSQSDGTQRLTHLLPGLYGVQSRSGVFVIDEVDRSMHPLLSKGFVRAFLGACAGHGSQLIATTHETALLDLSLLRRDEIWFVNKKIPPGISELYSLEDYKIRTDLRLDKAYFEGRFDAVPPVENELPAWVKDIMAELAPKHGAVPNTA